MLQILIQVQSGLNTHQSLVLPNTLSVLKDVLFVVSFITKLFQEMQLKHGDQNISIFWCVLGGAICWNCDQPEKHRLQQCTQASGESVA